MDKKTKSGYKEIGYDFKATEIKADLTSRVVEGYFAAFGNIDSDGDKIVKGAFAKSIEQHGPNSERNRKIAHLAHHDIRRPLGVLKELSEDDHGLYFRSELADHDDGNDALKLYHNGVIREHSIGFNYLEEGLHYVDDGKGQAHWVVSEVKLWEGSYVTFGANSETPNLSIIKSQEDLNNQLDALNERAEFFIKALKDGDYSKKFDHMAELELIQIQKGYNALITYEPTDIKGAVKSQQAGSMTDLLNKFNI